MNILEIKDLHKSFGDNHVLQGLTMEVPQHTVYGLVGRNGAGKTTAMKIVLGLMRAQSGTVTVCGETVRYGTSGTNRHIGFLPDTPDFYSFLQPREYLRLCGELAGMPLDLIKARGDELLEIVGLAGVDRRIGGFSRGMKQRLGIAQALIHRPRLLICDEPTSALDPLGRKQILELLSAIRKQTTVLFSTHILSDVERICDRVAVLEKGKLALAGTRSEIQKHYRRNSFSISFADPDEASRFMNLEPLFEQAFAMTRTGSVLTLDMEDRESGAKLLIQLLAREGITPERFEILEPSLEYLFEEAVQ